MSVSKNSVCGHLEYNTKNAHQIENEQLQGCFLKTRVTSYYIVLFIVQTKS